ncbi:MAG: phosphate acyltransferase PlsX [Chloroflexi bacterium]|nr:phosphate acyltransferase PlsX [Chloroflexota bacterium]MYC02567.1 phosphate acyltransferase PlsX [Chloroflexota bacterium]
MQRSAIRASSHRPVTVALDAMGGDNAPANIVRGALSAARDTDVDIILVGRGREIRSHLPAAQRNLRIHEASEAIAMDAPPTAVRRMRDSSIMVGLELLKDGEADAFLSFGNTGAVMAGALFTLGRVPGVGRPALGALFRNGRGTTSLLLDVGANVEARPQHLAQFATMGRAYVERVLRHRNPSVGLLNVGEEEGKGTSLHQDTYLLLERQETNFVGNIEGNEMVAGAADVIVSDGFTGNVAVKLTEGLVEQLFGELKRSIQASVIHMAGAWLMRGAFRGLRAHWDYAKVGSAPLFGIDGAVLVGHGRANTEAVASGIRSARSVVEAGVVDAIRDAVAGTAPVNDEDPDDAPPSSQRDGQVSDTWRYERR